MSGWTGVVAVVPRGGGEAMASRLPPHLHPVCGRPLVWHSVSALVAADPTPDRVLVVGDPDLPDDLFADVPGVVEIAAGDRDARAPERGPVVVADAAAILPPACVAELLDGPDGAWVGTSEDEAAAARAAPGAPLRGALTAPDGQRVATPGAMIVTDRAGLAEATRAVRDRLVRTLMRGGVTFILPDSVSVDVDVRIGRDAVVYPGAIIEGQTTVGDETVIGPGCRIISSWVGSGVEMKGWNYIAHTSIRNRAILEPYVRRGFD